MANPQSPEMRAGTRDRDACAQVLNDAMAQGRLTADEHDERLSRCYAAVTLGDLAALTTDLPRLPASAPPPPGPVGVPAATPDHLAVKSGSAGIKGMWASWAGVSVLVTVIWALSAFSNSPGKSDYFWPMWVIGPWGAVNAMVTLTSWGDRSK